MSNWKALLAGFVFVVMSVGGFLLLAPSNQVHAASSLVPACSDPDLRDSSTCRDVNEQQTTTNNRIYGPDGILSRAAGIIMYIGGIAAIVMIIVSGFTFMTGSGDPNTLSAAKKTLLYALVGVAVLVIPSAIIRFVMSQL